MGAPGGPKTGGRQKGTPNRKTTARYDAMARVNEALNQLGEDSLSGMRLLQEVIRSKDCPLDIRIQCSGLLLKHELPLAIEQQYIAHMPPAMPGETKEQQLAAWWLLYGETPGDDPEWDADVKRILERIASKKSPGSME
jgi:hypothetical protein